MISEVSAEIPRRPLPSISTNRPAGDRCVHLDLVGTVLKSVNTAPPGRDATRRTLTRLDCSKTPRRRVEGTLPRRSADRSCGFGFGRMARGDRLFRRDGGSVGRRGELRLYGHMVYHMDMARREVLVQLDDELVEQLADIAKLRGTNRSELLRRGARAVIEAEELAAADAELREAYRRQPADPALVQSAVRLAARTVPSW